MSYILDALKKSEQERGHGTAPNVQTLHSSSLNYHTHKTQLWPYFLLAAIIINLAALFYFIIAKPGAEATVQQQQATPDTAAAIAAARPAADDRQTPTSVNTTEQTDTVVYRPVSIPGHVSNTAVSGKNTATAATTTADTEPLSPGTDGTVVDMDELPVDILQHIPVLEFSAHVYSSNPLQRSIVINGRFLEEGDRLGDDLYLSEITPDGAIFDYQGQLFRRNVVSAWN